ncbi:bifunctional diguanylate cyclase/phosphodiesterase [Actinoplanes oblitus]|uniref:Bifunctional diguanylate cyclase/phosphodiesterase n=1 Tax=Actinoplanes oblitus TaxID=3040509 RepID=A0ABY8WL35_9ACTN|nr:bifunctional diguanylate cyclase/phosphodiesterase [Actinoplanes oblitus]WIM98621.1 bifunctional diguanylate cyclase/phosphodiesterase [Actinoplanes oblitus]
MPDGLVGRRSYVRDGSRARRRRSLNTTAALASVLMALGAYTIIGTALTAQAVHDHSRALHVDADFSEARGAITLEEVNLRHYQVEPSSAVLSRFRQAADSVDVALHLAVQHGLPDADREATRLLDRQREYRTNAEQLIALVADRDPDSLSLDSLSVTPSYYTLQQDVDTVSRAYHASAQRQADAMRRAEVRMLIGTSVGFGVGLTLVGVIWRMVLSYQRRLVQDADASEHRSLHDPLTGLPNRRMFHERLTDSIRVSADRRDDQVAVMIIDLDGFKAVNDTLGHQAGDQLLQEAGHRLRAGIRDGDLAARLGGDEFAVLLSGVADLATAVEVAERLSDKIRHDFLLDVGAASVSASIGLAVGTIGVADDELLRQADAAMYRAKAAGGGVAVYDQLLDAVAPEEMSLFGELRTLLDTGDPENQLVLYFQPQIRIADGSVAGVEALVRWRHPTRGLLLPAAFLDMAASRGLEISLTYHLLKVAVAQAARWAAAGNPLAVSVNISPRCLLHDDFLPRIRDAVTDVDLPHGTLQLELTESSVMLEPERARTVLRQVREEGILISVDDFGTGFSSLSQLRQLPADELKIDRSFVQGLARDVDGVVLVRSAIDLGHNLGLSVVAEGVEELEALAVLREMGCDLAQGFALSRPVPADEVPAACARASQAASQHRVPQPHAG